MKKKTRDWTLLSISIGILGLLGSLLPVFGFSKHDIALVLLTYVVSLTAISIYWALRRTEGVSFDENSGFMGRVAIGRYKASKKYIWLTANDLDTYDEEYLASLKDAARKGVSIRRIITIRADAPPGYYDWYFEQIGFSGFDHRVYSKPTKECLFDLNIIDGKYCIMYLPHNQIESDIFRHVLVITNPILVDRFQQMYQMMWANAKPVQTKADAIAYVQSIATIELEANAKQLA